MCYTIPQKILLAIAIAITLSIGWNTVFSKPVAKQRHFYVVIQQPELVVLSECRPAVYNRPRTLTDGKRKLHIIHGPCRTA